MSGGTRHPAEEARLLVMQEPPPPRRNGRRHGRVRGRGRGRRWTPSLSSISEDSLVVERTSNVERPKSGWRRSLKRKVAALRSERDRNRSFDRDTCRQAPVSALMPTYSATPFMF
ncbi:hypothetical protein Salat_2021900 [Sesamum alatum]|uniref:Uncharacterized protein n=1 Tax=Sesamum alatum TaxID=300844 RepID=A0AAE1XZA2_9LAMI|nr:hypothetical protein Salat_2021900 [Sesamum alatum]